MGLLKFVVSPVIRNFIRLSKKSNRSLLIRKYCSNLSVNFSSTGINVTNSPFLSRSLFMGCTPHRRMRGHLTKLIRKCPQMHNLMYFDRKLMNCNFRTFLNCTTIFKNDHEHTKFDSCQRLRFLFVYNDMRDFSHVESKKQSHRAPI